MVNEIIVKVSFLKHTLMKQDPGVVEGDYNTTRLVFEFEEDVSGNTVMFELGDPNGEVILLKELSSNSVDLVGYDEDGNLASLFSSYGLYPFELVWYGNNGKLTSAPGWLNVSKRQVSVEDNTVKQHLPVFDELIQSVTTAPDGYVMTAEGGKAIWKEPKGGNTGEQGEDGESAYEIALKHGFEGTEEEWLASLKGDKGERGEGIPPINPEDKDKVLTANADGTAEWKEPTGIKIKSAKVGQTIKVKAVDENSKPTEWESADFPESGAKSWNDLTDKPFGDESVTIEWDGDSTGKVTAANGQLTKISDLTPEPTDLIGGTVTFTSHEGVSESLDITADFVNDMRGQGVNLAQVGGVACWIAYEDGVVVESITIPKAGLYLMSSDEGYISSLSYGTTKKIDSKFLPDAIYGTSGKVTLTAANWIEGAYTLTVDDLGENDAIFFTPSTKADKTALEDANVFIGTEGQTVTLEADTTPTADITLDYFIVRGV